MTARTVLRVVMTMRTLPVIVALTLAPTLMKAQSDATPPAIIVPLWRVTDTALSVWVQPPRAAAKSDSLTGSVRRSMDDWNAQLLPVRMRLGADSANSGIRVVWIDHYDEPISGRTICIDDGAGHLVSARVVLAFKHSDGRMLSAEEARVLALHELGHALGLEHSLDSMSVMAPRVRVRAITEADRAVALKLYASRLPQAQ